MNAAASVSEPPAPGPLDAPQRALGPPTALAFCIAAAAFALLASSVLVAFGLSQSVQWGLYVLGVAVALPSTLIALAIWDRLVARHGVEAGSGAAALAAASLALTVIWARLAAAGLDVEASKLAMLAFALWALGLATLAIRPGTLPRRLLAARRGALWLIAAGLLGLSILVFATPSSIAVVPALCSLVVIGAAIALARLSRFEPPRLAGRGIDAVVILLVSLAAIDLAAYQGVDLASLFNLQLHQDFLLGPTNDVLGGRGVLTETSSQYGVASIYSLAAWFLIAPIGYGTFSFLNGLLLAGAWSAAYAILRLAGCSRALGAAAVAIGLMATVLSVFPVPAVWPQIGPLRFGLPIVIILAEALAARAPRRGRPPRAASYLVLALSSIWSLETFFYTALALASILVVRAAISAGAPGARARQLARSIGIAVVVCLGAHVLFAAVTLGVTGELPDWGIYLAYVEAYATGQYAPEYLFGAWPLGLLVGLVYLGSAIGLIMLVLRRRELAQQHPATMISLAGATGYGIGALTYAVARAPSLSYTVIAAFLLGGLWLGLALRTTSAMPARGRFAALALGAWVAALLIGGSWSTLDDGWRRSALAHALPGGDSLGEATGRLWDSSPLDFRSPEGERLLAESIPGSGPALVLTAPDLGTEILVRSGRINLLPMGHPPQDDLIRSHTVPVIRRAVAEIPTGTRMLTQQGFLDAPRADDPLAGGTNFDLQPVPLQTYALALIEDRFELQTVARGSDGLLVVELIPRSASGRPRAGPIASSGNG